MRQSCATASTSATPDARGGHHPGAELEWLFPRKQDRWSSMLPNPVGLELLALTWAGLGAVLALTPLEPIESVALVKLKAVEGRYLVTNTNAALITGQPVWRDPRNPQRYGSSSSLRCAGHRVYRRCTPSRDGRDTSPGTLLNPETDLIPVCANCHAMLHKARPPYLVARSKWAISPRRHATKPRPASRKLVGRLDV